MKQIRRNVFETNSSSTHSIAIPKKCDAPTSVDMVNREFAKSSTSTERYPLEDDIVTMFEKIRTN